MISGLLEDALVTRRGFAVFSLVQLLDHAVSTRVFREYHGDNSRISQTVGFDEALAVVDNR